MKNLYSFTNMLLALAAGLFMTATVSAQEPIKPAPDTALTYSVKPDYRKCAFPLCGGWFITPVNQYSLALEESDEAYQHSLLLPNSIYVATINYKALGLTPEQIAKLEDSLRSGQGLLRGVVKASTTKHSTLIAQAAWTSPNTNTPVGPYLKVSSSGIVCITTPCPYFKAELINSFFTTNIHELTFEKAGLDEKQESLAWQAVSEAGLVLTGVKYESQGMTGTGTGIAATKVYFGYPPKK
jgi:hypothetical protein